jgi:ribosomal protein S18 acetylase RimI-like enzyme
MQTPIRIRLADDADALELSALAERTFRDAFEAVNTAADMQAHCAATYSEAIQRAEIRQPGRETWVADADGRLVAYVQLRLDAVSPMIGCARPVEIQRFYVDASRHGGGLAHALMDHVLARAEAAGFTTIWLGVWEQNPRAIAFYRKWGFEAVGEHTFKLGHDLQHDLVMSRRVQAVEPDSPWR